MVRFDWFYVETARFKGSMTEAYFGLEYGLFKHFALGTAFNRLQLRRSRQFKERRRIQLRQRVEYHLFLRLAVLLTGTSPGSPVRAASESFLAGSGVSVGPTRWSDRSKI